MLSWVTQHQSREGKAVTYLGVQCSSLEMVLPKDWEEGMAKAPQQKGRRGERKLSDIC